MIMVLLVIYGAIAVFEILLILNFTFRFRLDYPKGLKDNVSILICARDEEENLSGVLDSLINSNYDLDLVEILVGDDNSVDNTMSIVDGYTLKYDFIKNVSIQDNQDGLIAKGNVLAQLVDQCLFEKVLIIDADMKVHPNWITRMSDLLTDYDMISGTTLIHEPENITSPQYFDWAIVLHSMKTMSDFFGAISILGNNMGFRKSSYLRAGGFRGLGPTDVEDLGLLRKFQNLGLSSYHFMDEEGYALTNPQVGFKAALYQRVRWMNGVFTHHIWLAIPAFFARLWFAVGAFALIFNKFALFILAYGLVINYLKYIQVTKRLDLFKKFNLLLPVYISLLDTFAFLYRILLGKVSWKGRDFK